jgi:hypothetical protein
VGDVGTQADIVLDAFASRSLIGLLSDGDPALDEDTAYAIAREVHDLPHRPGGSGRPRR